jgi:uncharacterized protein (TIRG00374 family)
MKRLNAVLLILGVGFLGYLFWRIGPAEFWQELRALGWGLIPLVLSEGAGLLAHTVAWRHCIGQQRPRVPLFRLFRMSLAGFAINYLTPSASLGGEVSKAALLSSTHPMPEAVSSVLLDKLSSAFAHLLLAVLGSFFLLGWASLPRALWAAMAGSSILLTGGMLVFLWLQKHGKLGGFMRWLAGRRIGGRLLRRAAEKSSALDETLRVIYRDRPRDLVFACGWHLLGHAAAILQVWVFLYCLGQPARIGAVAGAAFLSLWFDLLTFIIPLNAGALEGSRIVALKAIGNSASVGLAFGVAIRVAQVCWACFGLVSYALFTTRKAEGSAGLTSLSGSSLSNP